MTHESLKVKIMVMGKNESYQQRLNLMAQALYAALELHKPFEDSPYCQHCCLMDLEYPCPTIQAIEKELA
jgi:hypothetical protein